MTVHDKEPPTPPPPGTGPPSVPPTDPPAVSEDATGAVRRTDDHVYDLFVSYSHRADARFVPKLQRQLENLDRPLFRPRALDVFVDDTDLTADPDLGAEILRALSQSRHLLICASPEAAASAWVNQEIAWWFEHVEDPGNRFILALTGGDIEFDRSSGRYTPGSTAMPPALKEAVARQRRQRNAAIVVAVLFAALAALAVFLFDESRQQTRRADLEARRAEDEAAVALARAREARSVAVTAESQAVSSTNAALGLALALEAEVMADGPSARQRRATAGS